jgi:N6-L-threonylcarbamoyladenine synthase
MRILGIETTCDETSVSVVENGTTVLSNVIATSMDLHAKTGGVIPEQAARKQVEYMIPVLEKSLKEAFKDLNPKQVQNSKLKTQNADPILTTSSKGGSGFGRNYQLLTTNVDAIAVAVGPGLIGSLLVGVETAKTLAMVTGKPIIPVNHLVAHIYANWLSGTIDNSPSTIDQPAFPSLALVVSGGHTDLVYMKDHNDIKWIGGTRDDAAGEAFDKTARLLGLPYPGGIHLSKLADQYLEKNALPLRGKTARLLGLPYPGGIHLSKLADTYLSQLPNTNYQLLNLFPRPMIDDKSFDWSFSGLKTAVLRKTQEANNKLQNDELAAQIQEAIVDVLVAKTLRAVEKYKPKSLIIGGGVSANNRLRVKFASEIEKQKLDVKLYFPEKQYCTDNAAAIAACAYFNNNPVSWDKIDANPSLTITGES